MSYSAMKIGILAYSHVCLEELIICFIFMYSRSTLTKRTVDAEALQPLANVCQV